MRPSALSTERDNDAGRTFCPAALFRAPGTDTTLIARTHAMVQGVVAPWRRMLTRKDETLGRSDDLLDLLALIAEHGP